MEYLLQENTILVFLPKNVTFISMWYLHFLYLAIEWKLFLQPLF